VSDLGIGLILAPETFTLFNDSLLNEKFSTINVYGTEGINFCSMFYKPDYGIMHFVCTGQGEKFYKVLTGFSDYKFLPREPGYQFKSWQDYILQSFGVRRKEAVRQSFKETPNDNSTEIAVPAGHELFCPMQIKGDWIQVKYDCFYNDEHSQYEGEPCGNYIDKCDRSLMGWLRWRNGNQLQIDILLMP
jgi:hypothetical protein